MNKIKKLKELYKKIPEIECKGLCHPSCIIVPAAKIEIKRAREKMHGKNPFNLNSALQKLNNDSSHAPKCSALINQLCSIYSTRPALCRLYGVAEGLECEFGCIPKEKMNKKNAHELLKTIASL